LKNKARKQASEKISRAKRMKFYTRTLIDIALNDNMIKTDGSDREKDQILTVRIVSLLWFFFSLFLVRFSFFLSFAILGDVLLFIYQIYDLSVSKKERRKIVKTDYSYDRRVMCTNIICVSSRRTAKASKVGVCRYEQKKKEEKQIQ